MSELLKNKTRLLLILILVFAFVASWALSIDYNTGYAPEQPIAFSHKLHAGKLGMDCLYCHSNAEKGPHATVPSMNVCMGCHSVVATAQPMIKKLTEYYEKGQPVPWVRIHRLPDHVYFTHQMHLNAGVACQTCHGEIQTMEVVSQVNRLEMGDCLSCHRNSDYITKHFAENPELKESKYYYLRYLGEETKMSLIAAGKLNRYEGEYHQMTGMKKFQNAAVTCDICHQ
jgi:hypothetical protein